MSKGKLKKFAEMEAFSNVFQYPYRVISEIPFELRGLWREQFFHNTNPIVVELGCGKGEYTVGLAKLYPNINFIGVDIKGARLYTGAFTYIGDNVTIDDDTQIYPNVSIMDNCTIGKNCIIYPNVSIYHETKICNNVILHSGCVIGADGFGFAPDAESKSYTKIPQIGTVTIEDNVEIGANTCVDRSTMGSTSIRKGVKLDNLVQIAHNTDIGENTVMSAQVGIAGSTKIGEWCMFGGQVGIAGHIKIGNKVFLGAQSGIISNTKDNTSLMGTPAINPRNYFKSQVIFQRLPEMYKEIEKLKKEIEELKNKK